MSGQPDQHAIAIQWIKKGDHDLITAVHTLSLTEQCPYDTICFHAQQCVEKYVKALLLHYKIGFPKSHDLSELVALLPSEIKIPLTKNEQSKLTDYAIAGRYPIDDMEELTRPDAEEAVRLAEKIKAYIKNHLKIK